jgi:hypothetical protein
LTQCPISVTIVRMRSEVLKRVGAAVALASTAVAGGVVEKHFSRDNSIKTITITGICDNKLGKNGTINVGRDETNVVVEPFTPPNGYSVGITIDKNGQTESIICTSPTP